MITSLKAWILVGIVLLMGTVSAQSCMKHCDSCSDYSSCSQCAVGYFYDLEAQKCFPCDPGCAECEVVAGNYSCGRCKPGLTMGPDGYCFPCDDSCMGCSMEPENCTACEFGLDLVVENGFHSCMKDENCLSRDCAVCANFSGDVCEQCLPEFYNFKGVCIPCMYPCAECHYPFRDVFQHIILPHLNEMNESYHYNYSDYNYSDYNWSNYNWSNYNWSNYNWSNYNYSMNGSMNGSGIPPPPPPPPPPNRRLQGQPPPASREPIDLFTFNYANASREDIEDFILGYVTYEIMMQESGYMDDPLEVTGRALEIVNAARESPSYSEEDTLEVIRMEMQAQSGIQLSLDDLTFEIHAQLMRHTVCDRCLNGFFWNNITYDNTSRLGECDFCPWGCQDCDQNGCNRCEFGFIVSQDGQYCQECEYPCMECSAGNVSQCTSCYPPFSLDGNQCVMCDDPCMTCQAGDPSFCYTCIPPYSYEANAGSCFTCDEFSCEICLSNNPSFCIQCREGSVPMNGTCEACSGECADCSKHGETEVCYWCNQGFGLKNDQCERCPKGCLECIGDGSVFECLVCMSGAFPNSEGNCERCPEICETCDEEGECETFKSGIIEFEGMVVHCRPGCEECNPEDPELCQECSNGYFKEGDSCKKCSPGCKECNSWNDCTDCQIGFAAHNGSCALCHDSCYECASNDTDYCLSCRRGLIQESPGHCTHNCKEGCLECNPQDVTQCFRCVEGYAPRPEGYCVKCLGSCSGTCDPKNITRCLSCAHGFQLLNNRCERCPTGCMECIGGQCEMCREGYSLEVVDGKFVCQKLCPYPCSSCPNNVCRACQDGFKLQNKKCVPDLSCNPNCGYCPPGSLKNNQTNECESCQANCASCAFGECFECFEGYYLRGGSCVPCTSNCTICLSEGECLVPADGYYLPLFEIGSDDDLDSAIYGGVCFRCSDKCLTCVLEDDICTSCDSSKYTLNGSKCIGRYVVGIILELDIPLEEFLQDSRVQDLVESMAEILNIAQDLIFINSLTDGSTVVQGSVSSESEEDASSKSSSLSNNVDGMGFTVLSSSIDVYYDNQQVVNEEDDEESLLENVPVGAIVGGVIGAIVLIVVIGLVIYKCKRKDNEIPIHDTSDLGNHHHHNQVANNGQLNESQQFYSLNNVKVIYS